MPNSHRVHQQKTQDLPTFPQKPKNLPSSVFIEFLFWCNNPPPAASRPPGPVSDPTLSPCRNWRHQPLKGHWGSRKHEEMHSNQQFLWLDGQSLEVSEVSHPFPVDQFCGVKLFVVPMVFSSPRVLRIELNRSSACLDSQPLLHFDPQTSVFHHIPPTSALANHNHFFQSPSINLK